MKIERASKQEKKAKIQGQEGPTKQARERYIYYKDRYRSGFTKTDKQARYTQRKKKKKREEDVKRS